MKSKSKLPLSLALELVKVLSRVSNHKLFKRYLDGLLKLPEKCSNIEQFECLKEELFISALADLSDNDYCCFKDFAYLIINHCKKLLKTKS